MTDKEKRAEVRRQIEVWQGIFKLQRWDIYPKFHNKTLKSEPREVGYVKREYNYLRACIHLYLPNLSTEIQIKDTIIHELIHVLLADYDWFIEECCLMSAPRVVYEKTRENATEQLTQIIMGLVDATR